MIACEMGFEDVCRYLISQGAKTDHRDREGRGALLKAARFGRLSICKLLVNELGFSLHQRDSLGLSACLLAAQYGDLDTVEFLISTHTPLASDHDIKTAISQQKKYVHPLLAIDGRSILTIASIKGK